MTLKDDLEQFTGTTEYHKLSIFPVLATDGTAYFCEKAEAYWLFDKMAAITMQHPEQAFIVCEVNSKDNKCTIKFQDGNYNYFCEKKIPYTDLPEGEWDFFISNLPNQKVILLPSEY